MTDCSLPVYTPGGWASLGDLAVESCIGTRFTAIGDSCAGGVIYTGSGAGWSGAECMLFDHATGTLLKNASVVTGAPDSAYAFSWSVPASLIPGADYVIAFRKVVASYYAGNLDNAIFTTPTFYTPIEHLYTVGATVMPGTILGARPGIEPTVCNSGGYCQYGTEPNPGAKTIIFITSALIDAAILAAGGGLLVASAFDVMIGLPLLVTDMCSVNPAPFPTFTDADLIPGTQIWSPASFNKRLEWLKTAIWLFYCRCQAAPGGSPPPIPPPQPVVTPTPADGTAGPAPVTCDNQNLCDTLNSMQRQLNALLQVANYTSNDVTLIQRQGVPFGYVHGPVHAGLVGSGEFAVADILGLEIEFTTIPDVPGHSATDPDTYHQIGKVSLGTVDGWRRSWMPTHNPYLIFPLPGAFTRVGYTFAAGGVVTITELLREP